MDLLNDSKKLFIVTITITVIVAIILFYFEFTFAGSLSVLTLIGFVLLIGSGTFIYFTNMKKLRETKDKKKAIFGYLLYILPTIVISALLFAFLAPPTAPYLLVIGLLIYLVAYSCIYFLAMKAEQK